MKVYVPGLPFPTRQGPRSVNVPSYLPVPLAPAIMATLPPPEVPLFPT